MDSICNFYVDLHDESSLSIEPYDDAEVYDKHEEGFCVNVDVDV